MKTLAAVFAVLALTVPVAAQSDTERVSRTVKLDPGGTLHVFEPTTGKPLGQLSAGGGHWNSPIVVDRRIALPEGNANSHSTSGILNIWRMP